MQRLYCLTALAISATNIRQWFIKVTSAFKVPLTWFLVTLPYLIPLIRQGKKMAPFCPQPACTGLTWLSTKVIS